MQKNHLLIKNYALMIPKNNMFFVLPSMTIQRELSSVIREVKWPTRY